MHVKKENETEKSRHCFQNRLDISFIQRNCALQSKKNIFISILRYFVRTKCKRGKNGEQNFVKCIFVYFHDNNRVRCHSKASNIHYESAAFHPENMSFTFSDHHLNSIQSVTSHLAIQHFITFALIISKINN